MQQGGIFRSRNLRPHNDREQSEKSRLMETSSSFKSQFRSSSCVRSEGSLYKSALVFDNKPTSQQLVHQYNIETKREIASLTKIMTCYTVLEYITENSLIPEDLQCEVSRQAAELGGTNAGLEQGDVISVWDLLFGLMLPSGNDAALCLAENVGRMMMGKGGQMELHKSSSTRVRKKDIFSRVSSKNDNKPVNCFVSQMNKHAQTLKMTNTQYSNPHGLADPQNYSTCKDQLTLIQNCLKHPYFPRIVKTKLYFGCVRTKGQIWTREIIWENTNKLLSKGYQGIKTGNTGPAGYCLASWYCAGGADLIVIVLGCASRDERDFQTLRLTREVVGKFQSK